MSACPNCTEAVEDHPENGCVLAAFIGVLRGRGEYEEADLQRLHATCDVDALWDKLGAVVDDLGDGFYSPPKPS